MEQFLLERDEGRNGATEVVGLPGCRENNITMGAKLLYDHGQRSIGHPVCSTTSASDRSQRVWS